MRNLKAAVAVFCAACICAELVSHLTGSGWTRRGIKAIAGLYILAGVLSMGSRLQEFQMGNTAFLVPEASAVSFATWENVVLVQTAADLEEQLETTCRNEFNAEVSFDVTLHETGGEVVVSSVAGTPLEQWTPEQQSTATDWVQKTLGVTPEWKNPGGEMTP